MKNARLMGSLTLSLVALCAATTTRAAGPVPVTTGVKPAPPTRTIELNLDKAIPIPMPRPKFELKATVFKTSDNKEGWAISIPGGRPIATPAFWNGMLFVGGGYGSHEFYAFDAQSGALAWQYTTGDDGPTAAVVEDGLCAFNTESCTVYVLDAKTGKLVWQEWLGDPLMSQPAIYKGKLYMAYPAGQSHGNNQISNKVPGNVNSKTQTIDAKYSHRLLCADLRTGKHLWTQPITADAISAPIINDGQVLLTCQDGTSFCLNAESGAEIWQKANAGTSAPLATKQGIVFTEREDRKKLAYEGLQVYGKDGYARHAMALTPSPAPYLEKGSRMNGMDKVSMAQLDSSVGFSTAPSSAQLQKASGIPVDNVVGGWAYQGSRVATKGDTFFYNNGTNIRSSAKDSSLSWTANVSGKGITPNSQLFSPPAVGKENLYLASSNGHILSVNQKNGSLNFDYSTNNPITFQPALANGNVYVGTANGIVMCLKTGLKDAIDWTAWGGNAQHNKEE